MKEREYYYEDVGYTCMYIHRHSTVELVECGWFMTIPQE